MTGNNGNNRSSDNNSTSNSSNNSPTAINASITDYRGNNLAPTRIILIITIMVVLRVIIPITGTNTCKNLQSIKNEKRNNNRHNALALVLVL